MDGKSYDTAFVEYMWVGQDKRVMRYLSPDYSDDPWCSKTGGELYRSVYKFYGSNIESCLISGPLYFDLDGDLRTRRVYKELKRSVRAVINWFKQWGLTEQEIEIYFSGSKGFHVIIPEKVLDIKPSADLNRINKAIAMFLKTEIGVEHLDTGIYDRRRVLRLPGSVNFKTGLYKMPLPFDVFDAISLKTLKEAAAVRPLKSSITRMVYAVNKKAAERFLDCTHWARNLQAYKAKAINLSDVDNCEAVTINLSGKAESGCLTMNLSDKDKKIKEFLPCIKKALCSNCEEGKRNSTAFLIASSLIQRKMGIEEIKRLIFAWNERLSSLLDEAEIEKVVSNALLNTQKGKNYYGCGVFRDNGLCIGSCNILTRKLSGKGNNSE